MPLYGRDKWDAIYIITQIVAIQCWYYFIWVFLHCIIGPIFKVNHVPIMDILFDPEIISLNHFLTWIIGIELLLTGTAMSVVIAIVVERSKKCWDYCSTIYILHTLITMFSHSFPYSLSWWIVNGTALVYLTTLSERICIKREMEDIPVTGL